MCKQGTEKQIKLTDGRIKSCDECIQPLVQVLNNYGLQTTSSCCGHGKQIPTISLADGREIMFAQNWQDARMINGLFPPLHPSPTREWERTIIRKVARWLLRV